ncbi:MAG: Wzz/FepE/Etk N-terminal domain-containing protein, partial [Nitrospira sp.]|nr:Wzz/FepE/Etk N-terminal domain-containing protein [Nitrospira sp.]
MELQRYLDILKRRAVAIAIVTALTVSVVAAAGLLTTPIYTARAKVRVIHDVGVVGLDISQAYGER